MTIHNTVKYYRNQQNFPLKLHWLLSRPFVFRIWLCCSSATSCKQQQTQKHNTFSVCMCMCGWENSCDGKTLIFPGRRVSAEISQTSEITGAKLPLHKTTIWRAWACYRADRKHKQQLFYDSPYNNALCKRCISMISTAINKSKSNGLRIIDPWTSVSLVYNDFLPHFWHWGKVCTALHENIPSGDSTTADPNPFCFHWPCLHPRILTNTLGWQLGPSPEE